MFQAPVWWWLTPMTPTVARHHSAATSPPVFREVSQEVVTLQRSTVSTEIADLVYSTRNHFFYTLMSFSMIWQYWQPARLKILWWSHWCQCWMHEFHWKEAKEPKWILIKRKIYLLSSDMCYYKGSLYQQGQRWRDGCSYDCVCDDANTGRYTCHDM